MRVMCLCVLRCSRVPGYVLVENVKGFETSATRNELIQALNGLDFQCQVIACTMFLDLLPYYVAAKATLYSFPSWQNRHLVFRP